MTKIFKKNFHFHFLSSVILVRENEIWLKQWEKFLYFFQSTKKKSFILNRNCMTRSLRVFDIWYRKKMWQSKFYNFSIVNKKLFHIEFWFKNCLDFLWNLISFTDSMPILMLHYLVKMNWDFKNRKFSIFWITSIIILHKNRPYSR